MKAIRFEDLILWQDDNLMLINKPPGISTLQDRNEPVHLLGLVRQYEPDAQVCHRLDKETSGVLAIARDPEAYRHMSLQFEHRQVQKVYHAVVDGQHAFENREVALPIQKLGNGTVRISRQEGKEAITRFSTLAIYRLHTLMECRPVTGRMHQIRIHLATLKAPITGDEQYGGKPFYLSSIKKGYHTKKNDLESPLINRMALHAFSLEFQDLQGMRRLVEAPYPKDMTALIRQLSLNK